MIIVTDFHHITVHILTNWTELAAQRWEGGKKGQTKAPQPRRGRMRSCSPWPLETAPCSSQLSALLLPAAVKETHTHGSPLSSSGMVSFQHQAGKVQCFILKSILPVCKVSFRLGLVLSFPSFLPAFPLCPQTYVYLSSFLPSRDTGSIVKIYTSIEHDWNLLVDSVFITEDQLTEIDTGIMNVQDFLNLKSWKKVSTFLKQVQKSQA